MNNHKILFLDTETGGLNPAKNSLLSIGLAVWDNGIITDSTEILINDGILNVTEYALTINKIDLQVHRMHALPSLEASKRLSSFLDLHFGAKHPVTIAGHNVGFDVAFLKCFYETNGLLFHKRFSHRIIDTSSIIQFLYYSNILDSNISSSDDAFEYFAISVKNRHSALGDAVATAELFNHLTQKVRRRSNY